MLMSRLRGLGCLLVAVAALSGCDQVLRLDETALEFDPSETEQDFQIITDDDTGWEAGSDVTWVTLIPPSGTGPQGVMVIIDQSQLVLGENEAIVTVIAEDGTTSTLRVTVLLEAVPGTPYWPLAIGHAWVLGANDGGKGDLGSGLAFVVADRNEVITDGSTEPFDVWTVNIFTPEPSVGVKNVIADAILGMGAGSGLIAAVLEPEKLATQSLLAPFGQSSGDAVSKGGEMEPALASYWVAVDGVWYIAFSEDEIDELPDTKGMVRWDFLFSELGGNLIYLVDSGVLVDAGEEIDAIFSQMNEDIAAFLAEFDHPGGEPSAEEIVDGFVAMATAFGEEFATFDNGNEIAGAFVEVLSALTRNTDEVQRIIEAFMELIEATEMAVGELGEPLTLFLSDEENISEIVLLLRAFGEQFSDVENSNPLIQDFGRLLGALATGVADVGESLHLEEFTLDDPGLVSFFGELAEFLAERADVDLAASDELIALLTELLTFLDERVPENAAVEEVSGAIEGVVTELRQLLIDLDGYDPASTEIADLDAFTSNLAGFFAFFSGNNPDNVLAEVVAVVTGALDDMVGLAIDLNTVAEEIETAVDAFGDAIEQAMGDDADLGAFEEVFDAFGAFFEGYAVANVGEPVAEQFGPQFAIVMRANADVFGVLGGLQDGLADLQREERVGAVADFFAFEILGITFEVTALPESTRDLTDAVANFVIYTVPAEAKGAVTKEVPTLILGRDVGPVFVYGAPVTFIEDAYDAR